MAKHIDVFYNRNCPLCHKALNFLAERGLDFRARAVEWDGEAFIPSINTRALQRRCGKGCDFVPQIFIGDTHIPGWRKLEPMITSGKIEKVLKREGLV